MSKKKHQISVNIVRALERYFDLLSLERGWKEDRETSLDIAGREMTFHRLAEVTVHRENAEFALRGLTNVLRND